VSGSFASNVVSPIGVTSGIGSTFRWILSCQFRELSPLVAFFESLSNDLRIAVLLVPPIWALTPEMFYRISFSSATSSRKRAAALAHAG